ncbi:MAG: formylglycine-generating enzyme family protein [Deltaproteobacteria bacterium]|nr:formylglycine-generating enzyme family protein [Deltaproteobacteria bacterium]
MRRVMGLLSVVFVLGMAVMVAGAGRKRTVVAVFDIQTKFLKLSSAKRNMLTELLGQELGVDGIYQVMPPGDVKRSLLEQSAESHKKCYDEKCQVELGRQLPANKLVTTTIMKTAGKCRVMASLYDLRRQTTDIVAKAKCACTEEGLVPAIEKVAAKLRAFGTGGNSGFVEEIVSVDLKEKQGAVKVSAKDGKGNDIAAEVYVDGRKLGSAPGTFKVSVCAKELEVRHRKHGRAKKDLSIIERKLSSINVKLQGGGGGLQWIYSRPAGIDFTKSEVTVAQYRACVKAGRCTKPKTKSDSKYYNWGYGDRDKHPINGVDWNQAKSFCKWAGGRLPTEKEWEAEASNKGSREYPWGGAKSTCARVVMKEGGYGCGRDSTWPVCSKASGNSVSGLCDMGGNVWEWNSSWYDSTKKTRVVRGGSWDFDDTEFFRASNRDRLNPSYRYNSIGLRCGRSSQ